MHLSLLSHTRPGTGGRRRPQPYPREAGILLNKPPDIQLDIYGSLIILTKRINGAWQSYPVDTNALITTLAGLPSGSGLLPPNCLGTGRARGTTFYVVYIPPMITTIHVQTTVSEQITIPTPPLVWGGCGTIYRLWALHSNDQPTGDSPLYVAPFPNVYQDGGICWGDADARPEASASTLMHAFELFLHGSNFNTHMSNGKSIRKPLCVLTLYPELSEAESYPLEDMRPATPRTLRDVVNGEVWL